MAKFQEWSEIQAYAEQHSLQVIGVDEAGRGPLCGPVVAGADIGGAACLGGFPANKSWTTFKRCAPRY